MQIEITAAEERRYAELQVTALEFARNGETASLAEMLRHGLPVNLADAKGNTLLMLASYHGHLETAGMLLDRGAEVDRRNARGQTPLGGVAFKGYESIVPLLIEQGADINADNGGGMTPLMFAAMFGRARVVEQLEAYGALLNQRNRLGISASFMVRVSRTIRRVLAFAAEKRAERWSPMVESAAPRQTGRTVLRPSGKNLNCSDR
jgi:ankyrin repeat protein